MKMVSTELLDEAFQSLNEIAQGRGWSIEDTLRIVIDEGIASFKTEEKAGKLDGLSDSEKVLQLLVMLKDADACYAALKFQNYTLLQDNKTFKLNMAGFKGKIELLEGYISKLKDEIKQLKAELEIQKRK